MLSKDSFYSLLIDSSKALTAMKQAGNLGLNDVKINNEIVFENDD